MTGEKNVELIQRLAQAYADTDLETIDALLSDDIVFHVPGRHPLSGTIDVRADVDP
jgi:ketosteroid isomerase-like protein